MTAPFPVSETFAGHEREAFTVTGPSPAPPLTMALTSVTTWGPPPAAGDRQPFTIHFSGPLEPVLAQSICHVEHEAIGAIDMFMVPIGPDQAGMRYEAIFA